MPTPADLHYCERCIPGDTAIHACPGCGVPHVAPTLDMIRFLTQTNTIDLVRAITKAVIAAGGAVENVTLEIVEHTLGDLERVKEQRPHD